MEFDTVALEAYHQLAETRISIEKLERAIRLWAHSHKLVRRILVICSDDAGRAIAGALWTHLGVEVDVATNPVAALGMWRSKRHAVIVADLAISDDEDVFEFLSDVGRGPRAVIYTRSVPAEVTRAAARVADARLMRIDNNVSIIDVARELLNDVVPTEH